MNTPSPEQYAARGFFPNGLIQPPGSFRFSMDALLLASFAVRHCLPEGRGARVLDLGCGCGAAGLACLLAREDAVVLGVDCFPELTRAAAENAALLGVAERYASRALDLEEAACRETLPRWQCDVVIANMPYRAPGSGRLPASPVRRKALFAGPGTVSAFVRSAAQALRPDGCFALVHPWKTRGALFTVLETEGFSHRTVLPVLGTPGKPLLCLVRMESGTAGTGSRELPALVLRHSGGVYSGEALAFCPWLGRA